MTRLPRHHDIAAIAVTYDSGNTGFCCEEHADTARDSACVADFTVTTEDVIELCDWCQAEADGCDPQGCFTPYVPVDLSEGAS